MERIISGIILNDIPVTFTPGAKLKDSRKFRPLDEFELRAYIYKLSITTCLRVYVSRKNNVEGVMSTDHLHYNFSYTCF